MGRTEIYACGESVSRRNSSESEVLFSLKQEAPASIGGSTFTINEESTDDDITIDYYNLRRIIRHCRDAHIPLTLSNKENDYIIIIENKYLRLLKYCIILQVIANEEKEKLALLITSNQNKRLTLIQNQAIDSL